MSILAGESLLLLSIGTPFCVSIAVDDMLVDRILRWVSFGGFLIERDLGWVSCECLDGSGNPVDFNIYIAVTAAATTKRVMTIRPSMLRGTKFPRSVRLG